VTQEELVLMSVTLIVFAGMGVLYMAMSNRRAMREMEHRERLAMIERGLIPSPEADPLGFDAATSRLSGGPARSERFRSAGITIIGLGLALMVLLSFTAGAPGAGVGVGGAFAVLGFTLLFSSGHLGRSDVRGYRSPTPVRHSPVPADPPPPHVPPPPPPRPEP
jgi:hypothetical protein